MKIKHIDPDQQTLPFLTSRIKKQNNTSLQGAKSLNTKDSFALNNNFNQSKFEKAMQQSFYYSKNILQFPNEQHNGFKSFKKILNDFESQSKLIEENQNHQRKIDDILIYNKEQKDYFEQDIKKSMRTTFNKAQDMQKQYDKKISQTQNKIKLIKQINNQIIPEMKKIQQINLNQSHNCYAQIKKLIGPPSLQNCTINFYDKNIYLIGGKSSQINKQIFQLDLFNWKWEPLQNQIQESFFGHQTILYDKNLYIIGGQFGFDQKQKIRFLNNQLLKFDTTTFQLQEIQITGFIQRRNFASTLVGNKYIMVYGGMDSHNNYLSDPQFLNLDTLQWENYKIENDIDGRKGIAFNTMVYIQRSDYKINDLFQSYIDFKQDQIINNIQYDCIFAFGGKQEEGASNSLKYIVLKNKSLKWIYVQSYGNKPSERHSHSMNYCQDIQGIVIFGGFDTIKNQPSNDLFIYKIQTMNWVQVIINSNIIENRFDHSSEIVNSSLIIFGGHNLKQFKNSDLLIIELNEDKANQKKFQQNDIQVLNDLQNLKEMLRTSMVNVNRKTTNFKPFKSIVTYQPIPSRQFLSSQCEIKNLDLL